MRLPFRRRPGNLESPSSERELLRFVAMMVHDMGHRVGEIRHLAHSLRCEPGLQSARGRRELDHLARAADDLAIGLRIMRSVGSEDETAACEFVADVLQPAASFAQARLLVDTTARTTPRVRLRPGAAVLAIARLIATHRHDTIRCTASSAKGTVTFTLEFSRESGAADFAANNGLGELLRESGVLSARFGAADSSRRTVALDIEAAQ